MADMNADAEAASKVAEQIKELCEAEGFSYVVVIRNDRGIGAASDVLDSDEIAEMIISVFGEDFLP